MSRIVNLKTIRFRIFNVLDSWHTQWFENKQYQSVLFEDLALRSYLVGLFYRLKVPTNYFFIKRLSTKDIIIQTDLFFIKYFKKSKFKNLFIEQIKYFRYLLKLYLFFYNYFFISYLTNSRDNLHQNFFFEKKSLRQMGFIGLINQQKLLNALGRYFDDLSLKQKEKPSIFLYSFIFNGMLVKNYGSNLKFSYDKYFIANIRLIHTFNNKYLLSKMSNTLVVPTNGIPSHIYDIYISILFKSYNFLFKYYRYVSTKILFYWNRENFLIKYLTIVSKEKKISHFSRNYDYFKKVNRNISNIDLIKKKKNTIVYYSLNYIINRMDASAFNQKLNDNIGLTYWYIEEIVFFIVKSYYKLIISVLMHNMNNNYAKIGTLLSIINRFNLILLRSTFYSNCVHKIIHKYNTDVVNYFSYSLNFKKYFSIIKYLKVKYYRNVQIYLEGNYSKKLVRKRLFNDFFNKFFSQFILKIEETVRNYTKQNVYFLTNYYYMENEFPAITNAKIICDFIVYQIHSNMRLKTIFHKIRRWQLVNNENKKYLENKFFSNQLLGKVDNYLDHLSYKRYPIMGIRIECSVTSKKGTRKRKIFYGDWIKDFDLISKSPNNTFSADLDYYQSFAIVKSCSIGVKVWVFFKTHLYNSNNKFISLVSY